MTIVVLNCCLNIIKILIITAQVHNSYKLQRSYGLWLRGCGHIYDADCNQEEREMKTAVGGANRIVERLKLSGYTLPVCTNFNCGPLL